MRLTRVVVCHGGRLQKSSGACVDFLVAAEARGNYAVDVGLFLFLQQ